MPDSAERFTHARRRRGPLASALIIAASVGAATGLRFALDPLVDNRAPYTLYLAAVVASAYFGGWRAGAITTVVSTALASWLFAFPRASFRVSDPEDWGSALVFLAVSSLVVVLLRRERIALDAVIDRDARLRAEAAERKQLELNLAEARRLESIGRLAGGVAHDFNNLLAVILGSTQLLKPTAEDRELVENIETSAQRGADLARQLLGYAGRQMLVVQPVNLNDVVARVADEARRQLAPGVTLRVAMAEEPWSFDGDTEQVRQVLLALLANARDAVGEAGVVELGSENRTLGAEFARRHPEVAPGEYLRLIVKDDGPGLSAEAYAHLFEPFFTTKGPGRPGLGLAAVYGLVKQMKGHVFVESQPGRGVQVEVYWPRTSRGVFSGPMAEGPRAGARALRVLLVEDHEQVRETVQRLLQHLGHEVTPAANGVEALQLARRLERIDVLLTDVVMPWMNGRQLAEHLAPLYPDMKIVLMTGFSENEELVRGALLPGAVLLKKPFSRLELVGALEAPRAERQVG